MSTKQNRAWREHAAALIESGDLVPRQATFSERQSLRWMDSRASAGLSRAQASEHLGFGVRAIEIPGPWLTPEKAERAMGVMSHAAELYGVTECYLRGHNTEPSEAQADALTSAPDAYGKDLQSLAEWMESQAECPACAAVEKE